MTGSRKGCRWDTNKWTSDKNKIKLLKLCMKMTLVQNNLINTEEYIISMVLFL